MSQEDYSSELETIQAIPANQVKIPNLPIDAFLQDAEDLFVWAQDDKDVLIGSGLNWSVFGEHLKVRAGALRHAQSLWMKDRRTQEEAVEEWSTQSPASYDLRDDLIADFRFAFRKEGDLIGRVREISDGYGHADMIQDLSDLGQLGKANSDHLSSINFDMEKLESAISSAAEMADLLARANGQKNEDSQSKHKRDQAYTHLREAVDEIRATGRYVFRKDGQRIKGYRYN